MPGGLVLFNWLGLATFYRREMARNFKIWKITLAAPAIRAVLFASVFGLAIDHENAVMGGLPFMTFLIPGLVTVAALGARVGIFGILDCLRQDGGDFR